MYCINIEMGLLTDEPEHTVYMPPIPAQVLVVVVGARLLVSELAELVYIWGTGFCIAYVG